MRNKVLYILVAFSLVLSMAMPFVANKNTKALSSSDFNAGRIIDDVVFRNKNSMSVQQIQDFLNAKVPTCDRNHTGFTGASGTVYSPPWTCLKEYNENPNNLQNNIGQFNADGSPYQVSGGISAAQIIWNAAQQYNINPQVILATLQKESGIITDTWAASWQYKTAMGYGCPDTGPNNSANCSANYFGFYNQVNDAAWQFNQYIINPSSYNFQRGVTRYIQYSPDVNCGGSNVAIQTASTAALYNYTPYQPNVGALTGLSDSSPGSTVSCGAYGNRNFFWYFNSWFGPTTRSLVKTADSTSIYQEINGNKRSFPNEIVFFSYGYSWSDVLTVLDSEIAALPNGPDMPYNVHYRDGQLVTGDGNNIFLIVDGQKRNISSEAVFLSYSWQWSYIRKISSQEFNYIPLGAAMPYHTSG